MTRRRSTIMLQYSSHGGTNLAVPITRLSNHLGTDSPHVAISSSAAIPILANGEAKRHLSGKLVEK